MSDEYMELDGEFHMVTRADGTVGIVPSLASIEATELFIPMPPGWTAGPGMTYEYAPSGTMQRYTEMLFAYEELRKENERLKTQPVGTPFWYDPLDDNFARIKTTKTITEAAEACTNSIFSHLDSDGIWMVEESELSAHCVGLILHQAVVHKRHPTEEESRSTGIDVNDAEGWLGVTLEPIETTQCARCAELQAERDQLQARLNDIRAILDELTPDTPQPGVDTVQVTREAVDHCNEMANEWATCQARINAVMTLACGAERLILADPAATRGMALKSLRAIIDAAREGDDAGKAVQP